MKSSFSTRKAAALPIALTLVVGVGLSALLSGCKDKNADGPPPTEPQKFAFVTNNSNEAWKIAAAGIHKYEDEAKIKVDIRMPTTGTAEEQNKIIEELLSQGYNGIAVSVIAPAEQMAVLNKAADKTSLITFNSDAPESKRLLYIGTNNVEAGREMGEQILELLPKGGKVAVFIGTFSAENAAQRLTGLEEVLKESNEEDLETKIEIVEKRESTDHSKAQKTVEEVLSARSDVDLLVGLGRFDGQAIAAAIEASGKKGKILAAVFDDEEATLKGIADGTLSCTITQKTFEIGYQSAEWLHQLAVKPKASRAEIPDGKTAETSLDVIEATNVEEYKKQLEEMRK